MLEHCFRSSRHGQGRIRIEKSGKERKEKGAGKWQGKRGWVVEAAHP